MTGRTLCLLGLAAVLAAWAALSVLRGTADRQWSEVEEAMAAHAEAERAGGAAGLPTWTWDVGRNEPVPLPPGAEVVRLGEGNSAMEAVVVPEDVGPRTPAPLWALASAVPAWLFHGAFALAAAALGGLALRLR